jgi:CheY-like chemotaxis protein
LHVKPETLEFWMKPTILIVNDDPHLCETRRVLLESCGAEVYTACSRPSDVEEKLRRPLDLVLIDSTNVGLALGEQVCHRVKSLTPSRCVVILAKPESGLAEKTSADHLIIRAGPRQMLVEINELLDDRLDVNLWDPGMKHGDKGPVV